MWFHTCTTWGVNQGGGVGLKSNPNLLYLDVLLDGWKGFKLIGVGGACSHKGPWWVAKTLALLHNPA